MRNQEVAEIFNQIADILEIQGEIRWKILAYRKAARTIEDLSENIADILGKKKLPGIGDAIEKKLHELITTGKLEYYEKIKKEVPQIVVDMTNIPSIGPKTAKLLYDSLKLKTIEDLEQAARSHRVQRVKGIGPKTEKAILDGIADLRKPQRGLLGDILPIANRIVNRLKQLAEVKQINVAGSVRRQKETIRDIDILITSEKPEKVMQVFTNLELVKEVVAHGPTKSTIIIKQGIQVDCRVVDDASYGAALLYFTGSKEHNVTLRTMIVQMGYKLNEYGLFLKENDKKIAGKTEEEIYKQFGMAWIPPELREDRGEIEAARKNALPTLVEVKDIKGDLHIHSNYSDGKNSIEELVAAAKQRGHEYIAITDHVGSLQIANAMNESKLLEQISFIRTLNEKEKDIHIFAGAEVNIDLEGNLDLSEAVLSQLDIVIGSIHSKLKMPRKEITDRIVRALSNKFLHILGHPVGRILNKRLGSDIDLTAIFDAAKTYGKTLEINAFPNRLDLSDINSRAASQKGIPLAIGTDAHSAAELTNMDLGISVARRGWLEKKDILNTLSLKELQKKLGIK